MGERALKSSGSSKGAIRRNLRITDPDEIEQVFFGNAAFVRGLRRDRNEQVQREEESGDISYLAAFANVAVEWRAGTLFLYRDSAGIMAPRYNARLSCFGAEASAVIPLNFFTRSSSLAM